MKESSHCQSNPEGTSQPAAASGGMCVPIPTALAIATHLRGSGKRVGVLLAGKDDSAHLTVFPQGGWVPGAPLPQGALVTASMFPLDQVDMVVGDRHVPQAIRSALNEARVLIVEPLVTARTCLDLISALPAVDPVELVPMSPREPDAVTLWRRRSTT